jgi:hypothetical protein
MVNRGPSWSQWLSETPWGTTRLGLAARLACPAIATWIVAIWNAIGTEGGLGDLWLLVFAVAAYALAFLLPWIAQRARPAGTRISQSTDSSVFYPTVAATVVGILLLVAGGASWILIVVGVAQTIWIAVSAMVPAQ